jgi:hypothetical protein
MSYDTTYHFNRFTIINTLSFYEGVGARHLKIEESEVLRTNSTALVPYQMFVCV